MNIIETPGQYGTVKKSYVNVDLKYKNFAKQVRVLPAPYFDQPHVYFTLKAIHEPGEKGWPNGGVECYSDGGGVYNYELDQVIVHPYVLGVKKFGPEKEPKPENTSRKYVATGGKRGRKPLDPETKAQREADKAQRAAKSGGKRGRPKKK